MLVRAITLAGGLTGAAGFSQFPEFSQQYIQRLSGAVDELSRVVAEFDADGAALGLSRGEALDQLAQGGAFGAERARTMEKTMARQMRLSSDLAALRDASPFVRASQPVRFADSEIAARTYEDFKPAVPLTVEGVVFAGAGFFAGFVVIGALLALLRLPFRRRQTAA